MVIPQLVDLTPSASPSIAIHSTPPDPRTPTHTARRLEALSDIVFGLAMTFLASRLPISAVDQPAPSLATLVALLSPHVYAMVMSFVIASLYWFSHHRRLALSPPPRSLELVLNFVFLLLIMLLPTTTDMFGRYGNKGGALSLYCAHLGVLSLLNLALWSLTIHPSRRSDNPAGQTPSDHRPSIIQGPWRVTAAPAYGVIVFALATVASCYARPLCQPLLYSAFLTPLVSRVALSWRPPPRDSA